MKKQQNQSQYLKAAADAVERQALENPDIGIPVDPDVAEYLGAFSETALDADDLVIDYSPKDE